METRHYAIIGGLMGAILLFIAACSSLGPKEPRYEGKPLSAWVVSVDSETNPEESPAQYAAAEATWTNVVRGIGTNGLPFYSKWLRDFSKPNRQYRSQEAIEILGPAAEPLISDLAKLLKQDQVASSAARCLTAIGTAAIPCLTEAVETLTNRGQSIAISTLASFGPAAQPVVPALIQFIKNDFRLAWPALQALVEIETNRDVVLSLAASHIFDTNCASGAAYALGRLGNAAVPILLRSLTNETRSIRCFATGALDPQFQSNSTNPIQTNSLWFQRLGCEYNLKVLQAATRCYSLGDYVAATQTAEQFTNSPDAKIREAASQALAVLRPLTETNVPPARLDGTHHYQPKPDNREPPGKLTL